MNGMMNGLVRAVGCCLVLCLSMGQLTAQKQEPVAIPDFTNGGQPDKSHDWTLGPTGARGWMFGRNGTTAEARQILVTAVAKNSPAADILSVGDVILGINGQQFADDARIQFARAITTAETEQQRGMLRLTRWRKGTTNTVEIKLPVLGTYSATAPYQCPKSDKIFAQGCEAIAKQGLRNVSIPNSMNALALLASGDAKYRPVLAEYAKKVAAYHTDDFATWHYGYANLFLAEYYLATKDEAVFEGLKRIALEAARGQSRVGTWGHKFAMPSGNLNGYGCMNQPGLSLAISMVLAREAGVRDPALDQAITKAATFVRWYVNKGAIPYGDHEPWNGHEDNGKCSSAAVLFDLLQDREATTYFAKMSAAAYSERERGHTGNYFNVLWELPGVIRTGPVATGAYMQEQSWYYDMARSWDGSVPYQGSPIGEEESGAYSRWDCTGSYLLGLAVTKKSLYLTGKRGFCIPALTAAEAKEVIAAGKDYFPTRGPSKYEERTTSQLFAGLSSWSPYVRKRSAQALAKKPGNHVPELAKLLQSPSRDTRYGACEALAYQGTAADAVAPRLRELLSDKDPWLQSLAAKAIPALSPGERQASVSALLQLILRNTSNDPRHMAQRYASMALFANYPGVRGPKSLLADSLAGVNRQELYPAIEAILKNEDAAARGTLTKIYGKLTDEDIVILLPVIVQAIDQLAPSNEMFADGIRLAGLDLLSRLHIEDGLSRCITVIEPKRWGSGDRLGKCLECLARYGTHAQATIPQLQEIRETIKNTGRGAGNDKKIQQLDEAIAKIKAAKTKPTLVKLTEFKPQPSRSK